MITIIRVASASDRTIIFIAVSLKKESKTFKKMDQAMGTGVNCLGLRVS